MVIMPTPFFGWFWVWGLGFAERESRKGCALKQVKHTKDEAYYGMATNHTAEAYQLR